ncbi:MAG TPA: PilZ domain-containing protein [Candidatus Angelobacter sp.]|nr:PilZ domain-containing protein [Candidatus Angelobacter sp.]
MEHFSALVLSHDNETLRVINRAFLDCGLRADIAVNVHDANELLKDRKFDLAVCDYDIPGAEHLAYLEPGSAWRGMMFALIRQDQPIDIRGLRVHMTLPKPLTVGLFSKGLRAAYTTMAHERREAFRFALEVNASWAELVQQGEHHTLAGATIHDVSRTGMCIETTELLSQEATVNLAFELPDNGGLVNVEGEVMWTKSPGHAGIRFNHLPEASEKRLTDWLETKLLKAVQ